MNTSHINLAIILSTLIASPSAQAFGFFDLEEGINIVGLGIGSLPDYVGSDDRTTGIAPYGRYYFSDFKYVELMGPQLIVNLNSDKNFQFGPLINYRFGRDTGIDGDGISDKVVSKMREIDDTVEIGAFIKSTHKIGEDPRHRFNLVADIAFDAGGEHKGYVASARAVYMRPILPATIGVIGAGFSYADKDFMGTYYSVDNTDSVLSGLPTFKASSGVQDYRLIFGMIQHISPSWHLGVGGRLMHLANDAKDSPVVRLRGDKNQWIVGAGLGYVWQ